MVQAFASGAWWALCTLVKILASLVIITAAVGHFAMGHTFMASFLILGLVGAHVLLHCWARWSCQF
jgi:hypothetical protein